MAVGCERAREWASLDLDGELSPFERVLLEAHVVSCASCREFRSTVGDLTHALRRAPLEPFTVTVPTRVRRRAGRMLTPAVAALAFVAVGIGSIVASSPLGSGIESRAAPPATTFDVVGAIHDTVNARTLRAVQHLPTPDPSGTAARAGGGPYVAER